MSVGRGGFPVIVTAERPPMHETQPVTFRDRITPLEVRTRLQALAWALKLKPSLRHHLRDTLPSGDDLVFDGCFQFSLWDDSVATHLAFRDGKAKVGKGAAEEPDVIVRFKTPLDMRTFFAPGADALHMLLNNDMKVEGNLALLYKFGAIAADVVYGGKSPSPNTEMWGDDGGGWEALAAPPTGETCTELPFGEVSALDDPNMAGVSLDDLPAVKRLLWAHRHVQPSICSERARLLTEHVVAARAAEDAADPPAPALRRARAIRAILAGKQPILNDDDLLAGTTTAKRVGVVIYPETFGATIWPELRTVSSRKLNPYRLDPEDAEILGRQVFPLWLHDNIREWTRKANDNPMSLQLDERFVLYFQWKGYAVSHTIIDVPRALGRGLLDIRAEAARREGEAAEPSARDLYRGMQEVIDGVLEYAAHLATEAHTRAAAIEEDDPEARALRARLERMAAACERVPAHPPRSLFEAAQAVWILFLSQHQENVNAGLSIGRLDVWLQPYLERDLAGVDDPDARRRIVDDALQVTCALMLKCTDHLPLVPDMGSRLFGGASSDQVITLGGQTADGRTAVCDMTWIFLKATEVLRLRDPNVNARFAVGINSTAYLRRLCEVNVLTRATPSLHGDDAVLAALAEQGFTPEDARDWSATGCVEPTSCGRHFGHTGCLMFNMVAPLEMALNDGEHPVLGESIGPNTGDPREMATFDRFLDAYCTQLGWLIDRAAECNNMLGEAHRELMPSPLLSALFTGPMESGKDVIDGGAVYNSTGIGTVGLTDVVDSLCAVKTLVYDEERCDFATLLEALEADFADHAALLARIQNRVPRFGQDAELPRQIAERVLSFAYDRWQAQPHYRGGHYVPGYWSMSNHVAFGMLSGALPSGRRKGEPFTPGLTPAPYCDAPLTEQLRTVAELDPVTIPNNLAFNVKVAPGATETHAALLDRMTALAGAYFDQGGMQIQFNVMTSDDLRQAMDEPNAHRDLLVRISGYNAYFVELNQNMQLELIDRTEHGLGLE